MARACLLMVVLLALPLCSAVADTEALDTAQLSVVVEPFVGICHLAEEMTYTVGQNRAASSLTVRLYDQFMIGTNSDVILNGWLTGTAGTADSLDLDITDCPDVFPDTLGPIAVAFKVGALGSPGAYVVGPVRVSWVNLHSSETGIVDDCCGRDFVVQLNVDRDGLCDRAGLYTGTLTVTADTVACEDS